MNLIDPSDKRLDTVDTVERLPERKPSREHINYILARCTIIGFMYGNGVCTLISKEDVEKACA
ncbi:MAG: hypothetical protein KIT32_12330 [Rhodocyclaceae bacterium]|nr:hypothetical protein [Rhodocyclaceae bacterium]